MKTMYSKNILGVADWHFLFIYLFIFWLVEGGQELFFRSLGKTGIFW